MADIAASRPATRPDRAACCTDACGAGLRNRYFVGKRLTPDALRTEQHYLNGRRRLLNRALFGWGVVHGFGVAVAPADASQRLPQRLRIGAGLALDAAGRELLQEALLEVELADMVLLGGLAETGRTGTRRRPVELLEKPGDAADQGEWLLSVHYAEQLRESLTLTDPCACTRREWDQVCETVRYSLQRVEAAGCCVPRPGLLEPRCGGGHCCAPRDPQEEQGEAALLATRDVEEGREAQRVEPRMPRASPPVRGGCRGLCDHLTGLPLDPGPDERDLVEVKGPCGAVRVDLRRGVPLACVRLQRDGQGGWGLADWIEDCGPRPLVLRNELLYDLVRGCDLARISDIGWAPWHRRRRAVRWSKFEGSFGTPEGQGPVVTRDYWVTFSLPVRRHTLRADCFSMTILVPEAEGRWREAWRVPIVGVQPWGPSDNLPEGCVRGAVLVVDGGWLRDALYGAGTRFDRDESWVEIEVLGDYILDCNGQAVDANAVGWHRPPTGNGSPGGTFHSRFRVEPRGRRMSQAYGLAADDEDASEPEDASEDESEDESEDGPREGEAS